MAILPFIAKAVKRNTIRMTIAITLLCGILTAINSGSDIVMRAIHECTLYTPVLVVGYVCAKMDILTILATRVKRKAHWLLIAIAALLVRCCVSGAFGISSDIVVVPIFVIAVSMLFRGIETSRISRCLMSLGAYSTIMWFVHAIPLSDATRAIFQLSPLWTNNVVALFIALTISSYFFALMSNAIGSLKWKLR